MRIEPIAAPRWSNGEWREGHTRIDSVGARDAIEIFSEVHERLESAKDSLLEVVGQAEIGSKAREEQTTFGDVGDHLFAALRVCLTQGHLTVHLGAGAFDTPGEVVDAQADGVQFGGNWKLAPRNARVMLARIPH